MSCYRLKVQKSSKFFYLFQIEIKCYLINRKYHIFTLRGNLKKTKQCISKDIVQIGGQKLEREWVSKHIVKNRNNLFCMIYYSIWLNQGTLCLSVCTPDPQKEIRIKENVNSKPKMSWFLSKILGEGGRSTWSTLCQK